MKDSGPLGIKVSETAGIPSALLAYAEEQGTFAKHGLKVTIDTTGGGAATIPGVISGAYQFGGSNVASIFIAASKNLPIKIVASGTSANDSGKDFAAVLVRPDSGITDGKDLKGKTIAINALKNIVELIVKQGLENHGVDPDSVKLSEIALPDMLGALEQKRVDAVMAIEPFLSIGLKQGYKPIFYPYVETEPGMDAGALMASDKYISQCPDVVAAFQEAIKDNAESITQNPDAFRAALPKIASVKAPIAKVMTLPTLNGTPQPASLRHTMELAVKHGLLTKPLDTDALILKK